MRSLRYIRYALVSTMVLLVGLPALTQDLSRREERKLMKELRQEEEAKLQATGVEFVRLMVESRRFVLEADRLRDGRGNLAMVSSTLNFIAADSTEGVLQLGNYSSLGQNGVGGVTLEGPLRNYEARYDEKRGTLYVRYDVGTPSGVYHVSMSAYPNGRADATITSNWPGRLTYVGRLVPPGASRVYKGRSL